jgi:hypothetical protein
MGVAENYVSSMKKTRSVDWMHRSDDGMQMWQSAADIQHSRIGT